MTGEYVDLYDKNKNLLNEKTFREKGKKAIVSKGKYTIVVLAIIYNSGGEVLFQKTSTRKKGLVALPGGHVAAGQTSFEGIQDELKEEMNLDIQKEDILYIKTYKYDYAFKDVYYIKKDIDIKSLSFQEDEVEEAFYLSENEVYNLIEDNKFRENNIDAYNDFVDYINRKDK